MGRLVRAAGGASPADAAQLSPAYRMMLAGLRPIFPPTAGVLVSFEDGAWGGFLAENRIFEDIFRGVSGTDLHQRAAWGDEVHRAFDYLRDEFPALAYLTELLVTDVVLLKSDSTGGGSASQLPGLVVISPGPGWTTRDFAETLVHEMTHLNLFVLDMAYRLYRKTSDELALDEHRVVSAVRVGELRPFDKAFHSAVVAVPLMYMQQARGETALVDAFASSLINCCEGLEAKKDRFTPYGQILLAELSSFARNLDYTMVESGFTRTDLAA
ncbi:aKG-HExxH-type peptide beta-hydroxylase [Actinocorallia sp. A-T 12471]|uniref:aKG-HExxH-type peptide beta-hydroxylase n=1 Tax=Actinocorallia sp. A-T 12471 TaxID=3089813 RepID=UPI0029D2D75A|nr:HEXXH motif-containing putative peptide modification protein [Actinocorallia sp. A-T 12471]MDX6743264.1 HEXXH motif-containing putative peptide modification protein [Actinocorallia sp. A-T 12471]